MKKWWSFWIKSLLLSIQMTQITYIQKNYNYKKTSFNFYFRIGNAKFLFLLVNTQNLFVFCGCSRKHSSCIKLYTVNTPPDDEERDCIHWLDWVNIPLRRLDCRKVPIRSILIFWDDIVTHIHTISL